MIKQHLRPDQSQGRADRPDRYGRSDTSAIGRWFWEIDKVLLLLVSGADRHRPDRRRRGLARRRAALFGRQRPLLRALLFLAPARVDRDRRAGDDRHLDDAAGARAPAVAVRRRVLLRRSWSSCPSSGPEVNGARRWIELRRRPGPAVGVPQALLRRRHGLAAEPARTATSRCRSIPISALVTGVGRLPADETAGLRQHDHLLRGVAGDAGARRCQHAHPHRPRRRGRHRDRARLLLLRRRDGAHRRIPVRRRATISRPRTRCAR